jgi:hypothetical protein
MTLPEQSDRAVAQTREFLVRLASPYGDDGIKGIRREVRAEASRLLRHYPLSWNGDCPELDNGTNEDTVGRTLARRITGLQSTLEHREEVRRLEAVIAASQPTLTDAEREAVEAGLGEVEGVYPETAATLRGLLERL